MPKYKPYLQFAEFDSIVVNDTKLREAALTKSSTIYEIITPKNYKPGIDYPMIIILHGGGRNLEKTKESWKLPEEIFSKYIVTYLQSYLHYDSKTFGWRSGDLRAHEDVKSIYSEIINKYKVDTSRVFLFGISAGATMAFDLTFKNTLKAAGVFALCPGKPRDIEEYSLESNNVRVYMLGGENDFYLDKQNELAELFKNSGLTYRQIVVLGMGHDFPADLDVKINEGINFIDR